MKNLLSLVIILFSIYGLCLAQETPKNAKDTKKHDDAPISHSEYKDLKGNRERDFTIKSGNVVITPLFIDPVVLASELSDFCQSAATAGYDGIRFYPGLIASGKVVLIMCAADSANTHETDYHIFQYGDYTNKVKLSGARADSAQVRLLHKNYLQMVRLNGKQQPVYGASDPVFRKSRFYKWVEVKKLLDNNITTAGYGNYRIKFETGIVGDNLTDVFESRQPTSNRIFHTGFTVIMHILDENNTPLIDPYLNVDMELPKPYTDRYLEVGHPCPPLCGELHQ